VGCFSLRKTPLKSPLVQEGDTIFFECCVARGRSELEPRSAEGKMWRSDLKPTQGLGARQKP